MTPRWLATVRPSPELAGCRYIAQTWSHLQAMDMDIASSFRRPAEDSTARFVVRLAGDRSTATSSHRSAGIVDSGWRTLNRSTYRARYHSSQGRSNSVSALGCMAVEEAEVKVRSWMLRQRSEDCMAGGWNIRLRLLWHPGPLGKPQQLRKLFWPPSSGRDLYACARPPDLLHRAPHV